MLSDRKIMECSKICANFKPKVQQSKNVALIVGHTKKSQGATAYNGESEYVFNTKVAKRVSKNLNEFGINCKIFYRDKAGIYGAAHDIKDHFEADLSLELHFNAFKKVAFGTECLITDNGGRYQDKTKCIEFADILTDRFSEIYNMRERHDDGVKVVTKGDRGEYNLRTVHRVAKVPIALLFEPCFMNIKNKESEQIVEQPVLYSYNLAKIIAEDFYGV